MLEAIRDRAQGWFAKIILALLIVPFALWGVDSYLHHGNGADVVASVGGQDITVQQFDQALNSQRDRLRATLGASLAPGMLDSPRFKQAVLDDLVNQALLVRAAKQAGLVVPDAQLARVIADIPAFQKDGRFSDEQYRALLRGQNMTPVMFESRVRQELLTQQLTDALTEGAFASHATVRRVARLSGEQRVIREAVVSPAQLLGQVKVDPAAVKAYYDGHRDQFVIPERVQVEYLVLSPDVLAPQIQISEAELKKYYDDHASQYRVPEQRDASHILVALAPNASPAQVAAAQKKAEEILRQVNQHPAAFAELARKFSQDPGSAQNGGDLGFFGRGDMVKPFSDVAFEMSVGEIRGPVRSDFGFHIIKLNAIKPALVKDFAQVKDEIAAQIRKEKAARKFAEVADNFSNTVYEQADSLKPAADALKLTVKTSPWISRKGGEIAVLNNKKLLDAIFSDDTLKNGHNTEAIEVAPNILVSARVVAHQAEALRPFAEVSADITTRLQNEQADALARKQGRELLARLQQGKPVHPSWGEAKTVGRQQAQGLGPEALEQVFKADVRKLPAYAGVVNSQGGFTLFQIERVVEAGAMDEAKMKGYQQAVSRLLGEQYAAAYLASLKQGAKIEIKRQLANKEQ